MNRDKDMFRLPDGLLTDPGRCISANSIVVYSDDDYQRPRCNCSKGHEGNPYIADGCQDIDECQLPVYPCVHGTCINMPGTYRCATKKRIISLPGLITAIAVTAGFGLLFSLMGAAKITNKLKQRRAKKLRQKFFKKNHGLLLQQLISSNNDIAERTRIFSLEELEQATNKFDHNRILGGGGHGTVYKGILSDQRIVAIKKAKIIVQREIDQFINEVVILSQTNHRNVVKLFGCCLETEVPLLVYEFISNGALSFHLHGQSENPLSWKDRLRIALETARAIACLHSAASISVYHRDIKCANILLTDTLTSKVSDFGASRSIAIDETGILTAVQGTYGYLDPEYYYTSRLTEKSDVYSFGVILAELLTRVTPVFSSHSSEGTSLASHFVSHIRDNRFSDILDAQIVEEGGAEDAEVVARLAEACLSLKGEERPTMRQVETVLEDVQNSRVNLSSQITRVNRNATNDQPYKGSKGGEETRLYSLEKEFIESSEIPR
uniref:Protein kinase domain-containing protein n=1 Tax=Aegilops tauschii subsp. strangulata TaxID=200361 RepID=A0A453D7T5_AEGTS